ncbi:MAG TPA: head GIN domain-containing protein [Saprospiraceae bacterium]|nr:head GIN domain-containing protein [Saprospiraceae bacterium]
MKRIAMISGFLLLIFGLTSPLTAQSWISKKSLNGEGLLVKQEMDIEGFTAIGLGIQAEVYLKQGNNYQVEIEAQQNIIDALEKEVDDEQWDISFPNNLRVRNYKKVTIWITMPTLTDVAIGGSGKIIGETPFKGLGDLEISIGGSGMIQLAGDAKDAELNIAGSGTIQTEDLKVNNVEISIAGSGKTYIHVDDGNMDVSVAGSGKVYYKGKARVSTSIAGSGSVKSID